MPSHAISIPKPHRVFFGLCGPSMLAEKCEPIVRAEEVAHMGITEVVRHAPFIYRQFQKLKASIADRKPALAVLIDFPDVNFRLAKQCKALGIPVLWLVSPQLWAWKEAPACAGCSSGWQRCWSSFPLRRRSIGSAGWMRNSSGIPWRICRCLLSRAKNLRTSTD